MPSNYEIYRAWEIEQPGTICHAMIIDRGDGSAANRLTLTDKPYRDSAGFNGVKYHHTYPAPLQCIVSDIVTDEKLDGTSFGNIEIADGDGRFADIDLSGLIDQKFVIVRGDTRWSLLSTDFPYRFVDIARGRIVSFERDRGSVVLKIEPVEYNLDVSICSDESPLTVGTCWNVPAKFVQISPLQYRYSSQIRQEYVGDVSIAVMDRGVTLANPADYTQTEESAEFRGLLEFSSPPALPVTVAVQKGNHLSPSGNPFLECSFLLSKFSGEPPVYENFEKGDSLPAALYFDFNSAADKVYFLSSGTISRYSIAGDDMVSGLTDDSVSVNIKSIIDTALSDSGTVRCFCFSETGLSIFAHYTVLSGGDPDYIVRLSLSSAYNITSAAYAERIEYQKDNTFMNMEVKDGSLFVASQFFRTVFPPITRLTIEYIALDNVDKLPASYVPVNKNFISRMGSFSASACTYDDGKRILAAIEGEIFCARLFQELDTSRIFYEKGREYINELFPSGRMRVHPVTGKVYRWGVGDIAQFDLVDKSIRGTSLDYITLYNPGRYKSGFHGASSQSLGVFMSNMLSAATAGWSVDRLGALSSVVISAPEPEADWLGASRPTPTYHTIRKSDILGDEKTDVTCVEVIPKTTKYVVRYAPNFSPLSDADVAGSVSEELREALKKDSFYLISEEAVDAGRREVERTFDTYFCTTTNAPAIPSDYPPTLASDW